MQSTTSAPRSSSFSAEKQQQYIDEYCKRSQKKFCNLIKAHIFFHAFFVALIGVELSLFTLFFTFWSKSYMLAFPIAAFFLTVFVYGILFSVFQSKKTDQLWSLKNQFTKACAKSCEKLAHTETHYVLANALLRLNAMLKDQELRLYPFCKKPDHLTSKISCLLHWKDVLKMQEVLILGAIDHYMQIIKRRPTDIELHTHLANAFVNLSRLYLEPKIKAQSQIIHLNESGSYAQELTHKFKTASASAIEEFKILNTYAPNDAWIHAKLAACYHQLHMFEEEITAYEKILAICPDDLHTMYRLSTLYFKKGKSAKGLRLYAHLKKANFEQCDRLLDHYDASLKKAMLAKSCI